LTARYYRQLRPDAGHLDAFWIRAKEQGDYPPGGSSRPHRHPKSAFIYAYVVSDTIESQVEGEPANTYRAGESFFESPGAHHVLGRNVSVTEPAKLLAVFVVDTADKELTTTDR
jgi:quercetin dioxygenase-like cupin family protein